MPCPSNPAPTPAPLPNLEWLGKLTEEILELHAAGRFSAGVGEADNFALPWAVDCAMRLAQHRFLGCRSVIKAGYNYPARRLKLPP